MISFNPTTLGAAGSGSANSTDELGQDDFLKLLVAQMKNQDPVNPVENNEFLGQIAQFSMVSGIEEMNSSFGGFESNFFTNQAMEAAQLVGKEVLANDPSINFVAGNEVHGAFEASGSLHGLTVAVRTAAGDLVRTLDYGSVNPGVHNISWDGKTDAGDAADDGNYVLEASALLNGEPVQLPVQLFHRVQSTSIDHNNGRVALNLANAETINFSLVQKIR